MRTLKRGQAWTEEKDRVGHKKKDITAEDKEKQYIQEIQIENEEREPWQVYMTGEVKEERI